MVERRLTGLFLSLAGQDMDYIATLLQIGSLHQADDTGDEDSAQEIAHPAQREAKRLYDMPQEIRNNILSSVVHVEKQHGGRLCRLASVCKEWQLFFEAQTFRTLSLRQHDLNIFCRLIRWKQWRLGYIRHLWLRVELPNYFCDKCGEPETEAEITR